MRSTTNSRAPAHDLISLSKVVSTLSISRTRLEFAIKNGEIQAAYTGLRGLKVRKAAAATQQAA